MNARILFKQSAQSAGVFLRDVGHGLLEVSHNTLALLGLAVVAVLIFMGGKADVRAQLEHHAFGWLKERQEERAEREGNILAAVAEPEASQRATALDPRHLQKDQAAVVAWLSKRYRVASEPVSRLAQEAWKLGPRAKLEPTLIMAVIAVESSFNPFAQSAMGAQGLMQVMTRVHDAKFQAFGGVHATFDPVSNLKVGVQVLRDCMSRGGNNVEDGLRCYVGAANGDEDNQYPNRVLAEYRALQQVAAGKSVPFNLGTGAAPAASASPAPSTAAGGSPENRVVKVAQSGV